MRSTKPASKVLNGSTLIDTGTHVNGKNQYYQVVCNPFYTAYFTRENKISDHWTSEVAGVISSLKLMTIPFMDNLRITSAFYAGLRNSF